METTPKIRQRRGRIICMLCNEDEDVCFKYLKQLYSHLESTHSTKIVLEKKQFSSEEEFFKWKKSEEDSTKSVFVKDTSGKKLRDGSTAYYYLCHRSFAERIHSKSENRDQNHQKTKQKGLGSNKTGLTCPAQIKAVVNNKKVEIEYYSTHMGHDFELGRMPLRKEDRIILAGRLSIGVPVKRILTDVRQTANEENLRRIDLVTRDDCHNTKRSFNLDKDVRKHSDDATSVRIWINEMATLENENPVLLYKPLNAEMASLDKDQFMLIIMTTFQKKMLNKFGSKGIQIDGTHETNEYKFQLYTLLVVDELNEGIPVAFCFSNRETTETFRIFFSEIKKSIGKPIHTEIFMSDGADAFYNAWVQVMPTPARKLLCLWHVNKNWIQHANGIPSSKRDIVLKTLRVLSEELDPNEFENQIETFLLELHDDPDTLEFYKYFNTYYVKKKTEWARCYRKHSHIHTNMHLEALHRTIKVDYLKGRRSIRLDVTINALMDLLRDKKFERIIKFEKKKPCKKNKAIRKSHEASHNYIENVISKTDDEWIVGNYKIIRNTEISDSCCLLKCDVCKICVHNYMCSCPDNAVNFNICKHIHAVATSSNPPVQIIPVSSLQLPDELDYNESTEPEARAIENVICTPSTSELEIKTKAELVFGYTQTRTLNPEKSQEVLRHFDKIINIFQGEKNSFPSLPAHIKRKSFTPQTFFPKKKKKVSEKMPRVSNDEASIIKDIVLA